MMSRIFARAFRVPEDHVIEAGYPRNDILFQDTDWKRKTSVEKDYSRQSEDRKRELENRNKVMNGDGYGKLQNLYLPKEQELQERIQQWRQERKIILGYLPTFRPSEVKFFEICDPWKLHTYLTSRNMILICKLHPKSVCKKLFENIEYSNIYNVSADVDVNSFLGKLDLLIADYSSVYSDYMLLDRPVVAFHYDYEEYVKDTRDAYFDFEEYMPEIRAYNMEELTDGIRRVLIKDANLEKRRDFRKKIFQNVDGMAAERLVKRICKLL